MSKLELPASCWAMATLGELSEIKSGVGFPKRYQGQSSGDYPVYKVGDISRAVTQCRGVLNAANHYVAAEEAGVLKGTVFRAGSTLFAKIGEAVKLNRRAFVTRQGLADNNVMAVIPFLHESDKYLHHFLRTVDLSDVSRSTTVPSVRKGDIEELRLPLPPLAEQKAISEKLDTLLAQVETTTARLERIPQILKRFRQSVLEAAVSGRLTEEWRGNTERYFHPLSDNWKWPPIPHDWVVKNYSELVESRLGKMLDKAKNTGIPTKYLGNINVRWFDFKLSEVQEIRVSETERDELTVRAGDVLICEGGEPGRCAVWGGCAKEKMVFQKALHRARVSEVLLPEWLALNLKHDADSLTLDQLFTGTTIKHLTGKALKMYPLRVPPIEEQTQIVHRLNQLFTHADRIEQQVQAALERVNNLTQSILAKAFRGELTEQWRKDNPELISGENSAAALLERIKAERAAMQSAKKGQKTKMSS